ncbi:MAG: GNAT family N-acetyltransferase [Ignavibacteriae bacterium]|nr:GNAT family N-acetyltransferase [Ignavibacteriota bacterium]
MEIEAISKLKPSQIAHFDCGVEELNFYLKRFAKKNDRLGIGRTYVLLDQVKAIGYYTVSMAQIEFESLSHNFQQSLPKYPLPAVRIGRLAIDKNFQGKGLGEHLLMDSLERCERVSKEIAVFAVIVDAKNNKAKDFYIRYGFIPFIDRNLSLFLPMSTINQI